MVIPFTGNKFVTYEKNSKSRTTHIQNKNKSLRSNTMDATARDDVAGAQYPSYDEDEGAVVQRLLLIGQKALLFCCMILFHMLCNVHVSCHFFSCCCLLT